MASTMKKIVVKKSINWITECWVELGSSREESRARSIEEMIITATTIRSKYLLVMTFAMNSRTLLCSGIKSKGLPLNISWL